MIPLFAVWSCLAVLQQPAPAPCPRGPGEGRCGGMCCDGWGNGHGKPCAFCGGPDACCSAGMGSICPDNTVNPTNGCHCQGSCECGADCGGCLDGWTGDSCEKKNGTEASQGATVPNLVDSFSSTRQDSCGGGFPGCPSGTGRSSPNISFSLFAAQDLAKGVLRIGPSSLLPKHENQVVVTQFEIGMQYFMHVDASTGPQQPRVINCTRVPLGENISVSVMRSAWIGWLGSKAVHVGTAPCNGNNVCQKYEWNSTFDVFCANGSKMKGVEPERWFVGTRAYPPSSSSCSSGTPVPLVAMMNDIHHPECDGGVAHVWYHTNWESAFQSPVSSSVFDVPPATSCPFASVTRKLMLNNFAAVPSPLIQDIFF